MALRSSIPSLCSLAIVAACGGAGGPTPAPNPTAQDATAQDTTADLEPCAVYGYVRQGQDGDGIGDAELRFAPLRIELGDELPPVEVGATEAVHTDATGRYVAPPFARSGEDAQRASGMLRVDVSAPGFRSRRFYLGVAPEACDGPHEWEPLSLSANGDTTELMPDLIVDPRSLLDWHLATDIDCFDIVGEAGIDSLFATQCLRFDVAIANAGAGDLELHAPAQGLVEPVQYIADTDGGTRSVEVGAAFINHLGHGHVHLDRWVSPRLRRITDDCQDAANADACPVAREGQKISFCLADTNSFDPHLAREGQASYTCGADEAGIRQGIGAGWSDLYSADLEGQAIDLRGLASGAYWLEAEVNVGKLVEEESYENNVSRVQVELQLPECGDGEAAGFEACDGNDLRGKTCESLGAGYVGGALACDGSCRFDLSGCEAQSCPSRTIGSTMGDSAASGTVEDSGDAWHARRCGGRSDGSELTLGWTAPSTDTFVFDTFGSDYDTVLYLIDGSCQGTELACNDDAQGHAGTQSLVAVELREDQEIVIVVDAFDEAGRFVLNIERGGVCGNGVVEGHEQCDGPIDTLSCSSLGFSGGTLRCSVLCQYDTRACEVPAP